MGKYVIPARRKKSTPRKKSKSKSRSKSRSKSKPRNSQPIKRHTRNKTAKYIPPHKRRNKKQKSRTKRKSTKKETPWENDWNWPPKIDKLSKKVVYAVPTVNPKPPSPSNLPEPDFSSSFKPHKSSVSPVKFNDEDMKIIKTVLEDAFKPSPEKNKLLTPLDILNYGKGTKAMKKKKRRKTKKKK